MNMRSLTVAAATALTVALTTPLSALAVEPTPPPAPSPTASSTASSEPAPSEVTDPIMSPHSPNGVPAGPVGRPYLTWPLASSHSKLHPGSRPMGANDCSCRPSPGTRPVVLIPGTGEDAFATWSLYAPQLKAAGLCVYTFNVNPVTNPMDEAKPFSGHIRSSAAFLGTFVDRVLASTGADKVDLVGHSQGGGPLPRAYLKYEGGSAKVARLIGLVPSNHGTTVYGLQKLLAREGTASNWLLTTNARLHNNYALPEQLVGSPFLTDLNKGGMTQPGVEYTVITTRYDDVVTPYTNAVIDEPGVKNIVMQDLCTLDHTDHFGFTYDPVALQVVINTLRPEKATPLKCVYVPGYIQ
ncbi:lipase [Mobilicoccus sp.]|uniref:lipase n=1 Tax=Mobilicoccus sp. TaxID=2034349 RepID=UPI0028AF3A02|nr:lipase [Mobilicoccus sp.]